MKRCWHCGKSYEESELKKAPQVIADGRTQIRGECPRGHFVTFLPQGPKRLYFGKYKGKTIREVGREDKQYLQWVLENIELKKHANGDHGGNKMTERDLVAQFKSAKAKLDETREQESLASAELTKAETALLEHLEATQANATARYDGLGYVKLQKPRLYASVAQEHLHGLLEFLKMEGREDLVKTTVNPQSLSSYVAERIEQGLAAPEGVSYFLKPQLRIYGD